MSQVFSTGLIEVYKIVVKANTSDQKAEQFSGWEAANHVTLYICILQLVNRAEMTL